MATIASRDTTGILSAGVGEREVVEKRTRAFKTFLLPVADDGRQRFRVGGSIGPMHYRLDPWREGEAWKDIDLSLEPGDGNPWDWRCITNGYQVHIANLLDFTGQKLPYVAQFRRGGSWLRMAPVLLCWENDAGERQVIARPTGGIKPTIDNDANTCTWAGAFGAGLDFSYNVRPDKFFKTLIVREESSLPKPTIGTKGLRLTIVMALAWSRDAAPERFAKDVRVEAFDETADPFATVVDGKEATWDEENAAPGLYPHIRERDGQQAFWVQEPAAWDSWDGPENSPCSECENHLCCAGRQKRCLVVTPLNEETDAHFIEAHSEAWEWADDHNGVPVRILRMPCPLWDGRACIIPTGERSSVCYGTDGLYPDCTSHATDSLMQAREAGLSNEFLRNCPAWHEAHRPRKFAASMEIHRCGSQVFASISTPAAPFSMATFPLYLDTAISEEQIAASSDDADGDSFTGTTIWLNQGPIAAYFGFRFTPPIPQGATIDSAALTFEMLTEDDPSCHFYGDDVDDSPTFTLLTLPNVRLFSTATTAYVAWNGSDVGSTATSPDLSTVVEEITDRASWSSSNGMTFIGSNDSNPLKKSCRIKAYDDSASVAAKFNCTYTAGAAAAGNYFRNTRLRNVRCSPKG